VHETPFSQLIQEGFNPSRAVPEHGPLPHQNHLSVGCVAVEHPGNVFGGQFRLTQKADSSCGVDLDVAVTPVTRPQVDLGRRQQTDVAVVVKRRDRQPRQHREGPYCHQLVRHDNIFQSQAT
jgi:hypothetical protein